LLGELPQSFGFALQVLGERGERLRFLLVRAFFLMLFWHDPLRSYAMVPGFVI